jgi:DNA-binding XRE family transcriptional regulator
MEVADHIKYLTNSFVKYAVQRNDASEALWEAIYNAWVGNNIACHLRVELEASRPNLHTHDLCVLFHKPVMAGLRGATNTVGAISFYDTLILSHYQFVVNISLVYNQHMGKRISVNGRRLQQLRVEQALTLRALGERSGISYDTINKLELGRRPAHASTIRKLADALGVEPKELMKGDDDV